MDYTVSAHQYQCAYIHFLFSWGVWLPFDNMAIKWKQQRGITLSLEWSSSIISLWLPSHLYGWE